MNAHLLETFPILSGNALPFVSHLQRNGFSCGYTYTLNILRGVLRIRWENISALPTLQTNDLARIPPFLEVPFSASRRTSVNRLRRSISPFLFFFLTFNRRIRLTAGSKNGPWRN